MLVRPRQSLEVLSISSLDLFASALGVFILIAILMFPYYLRQPSIESDLEGARRELSAAGPSVTAAKQRAREAAQARAQAEADLAEARQAFRDAEALATETAGKLAEATNEAAAATEELGSLGKKIASLAIVDLDLVFVMDTTGSMKNELLDIQVNMSGIIRVLHRLAPTLNVGFVAYKDRTEEYVTRVFPMTAMTAANLERILDFVQQMTAKGGGDIPEPVDQALQKATAMAWRPEAQGLIIVIGDEPAHAPNWEKTFEMASAFHKSVPSDALPRRVSTIFSGQRPRSRQFFRRLAEAGGGAFAAHRGQMIESVLLSVLQPKSGRDE